MYYFYFYKKQVFIEFCFLNNVVILTVLSPIEIVKKYVDKKYTIAR